jgi:dCMP deaminase
MKERQIEAHMTVAYVYSQLSYCCKMKVGSIVVSDDGERVISIGYNGTPSGWDNICELPDGLTKPEVTHAEANAIDKLATCTESARGGFVFCTHSPCQSCAVRIGNAKIDTFYYVTQYRDAEPITYLKKRGVTVTQLPEKQIYKTIQSEM